MVTYLVWLLAEHAINFTVKLSRFDFFHLQVRLKEDGFILLNVVCSVSGLKEFRVVVLLIRIQLRLCDNLGINAHFPFVGFAFDDVIWVAVLLFLLSCKVNFHSISEETLSIEQSNFEVGNVYGDVNCCFKTHFKCYILFYY